MKATELHNTTEETIDILKILQKGYQENTGRNTTVLVEFIGNIIKGLEDSLPWIEAQEAIEEE